MKILNKGSIKKKFDKKIHKEEISKEAKDDIHYMKGDLVKLESSRSSIVLV